MSKPTTSKTINGTLGADTLFGDTSGTLSNIGGKQTINGLGGDDALYGDALNMRPCVASPPVTPSDSPKAEVRMGPKPENMHLLSDLPGRLSTELFASAKLVRLVAGDALFLAGDFGDDCYRIEDGLLKVTMVSLSGDERILAFVGRGDIVGELSLIDALPRSASVVAVRDATLSCLTRRAFETFANKHPTLYKSLIGLLAKRLRETDTVVAAGSFLSLKGRVARTILELAENFGQEVGSGRIVINQKIGQNDIAAMAGVARENVTRILNDWQREKLVTRQGGYYCLENKAQLEHKVKL